jgi:hypothetical protein
LKRESKHPLFDRSDPKKTAELMTETFGPDADTAAASCRFTAYCQGWDREFRFWVKVYKELQTWH